MYTLQTLVHHVHILTVHYRLTLLVCQVIKLRHQRLISLVESREGIVKRCALTLQALLIQFHRHITVLKYQRHNR